MKWVTVQRLEPDKAGHSDVNGQPRCAPRASASRLRWAGRLLRPGFADAGVEGAFVSSLAAEGANAAERSTLRALLPLFHTRSWNRHPELNHLGDDRAHVAVQRLRNVIHLHAAAGMIAQNSFIFRSPDPVLVVHATLQRKRIRRNVITAARCRLSDYEHSTHNSLTGMRRVSRHALRHLDSGERRGLLRLGFADAVALLEDAFGLAG